MSDSVKYILAGVKKSKKNDTDFTFTPKKVVKLTLDKILTDNMPEFRKWAKKIVEDFKNQFLKFFKEDGDNMAAVLRDEMYDCKEKGQDFLEAYIKNLGELLLYDIIVKGEKNYEVESDMEIDGEEEESEGEESYVFEELPWSRKRKTPYNNYYKKRKFY